MAIPPKENGECVTVLIKFCQEHSELIRTKQIELKEKGLKHGKDKAVKALLDELIMLKDE